MANEKKPDEKPRIYFDDLKHRWSKLWVASGEAFARSEESGHPTNVIPLAPRRAAARLETKR